MLPPWSAQHTASMMSLNTFLSPKLLFPVVASPVTCLPGVSDTPTDALKDFHFCHWCEVLWVHLCCAIRGLLAVLAPLYSTACVTFNSKVTAVPFHTSNILVTHCLLKSIVLLLTCTRVHADLRGNLWSWVREKRRPLSRPQDVVVLY